MKLKTKVLIEVLSVPALFLVFFGYLFINDGATGFSGVRIYMIVIWVILTLFIIFYPLNYLTAYEIHSDSITLKYRSQLGKEFSPTFRISSVVKSNVRTRWFSFHWFDVLSIKFVDENGLYHLLKIRVQDPKDWIAILNTIQSSSEK